MSKKILIAAIVLVLFPMLGFGQTVQWAKGFGGANDVITSSMAVDASGNIYTTGVFYALTDFDPGPGIFNLNSIGGGADIFISKINSSGNFVWAKRIGGNGYDFSFSIALDSMDNVYTTGNFISTVDFDPGIGTYNISAVNYDVFISKLDSGGNFIWAKSMGGINSTNYGNAIKIDPVGNVYTTGAFENTTDFNPDSLVNFNLTASGNKDIFVSKLDYNGNFLWAKSIGGLLNDEGYSFAFDANSNVYITGFFDTLVDFDPGSGIYNLSSAGGNDIFILKLDSSGNFVLAKAIGGAIDDEGYSIAVDNSENIYTTGYIEGTVDLNPDSAVSFNLTSSGDDDIFISKLNSFGNFVWAKKIGGSYEDGANSMILDSLGNIYTTGVFWDTVDFDPGVGIHNMISAGDRDIFILKLDNSGNFTWVKTVGGSLTDGGQSLAFDENYNIYVSGIYRSSSISFGSTSLTNTGHKDVFVTKLSTSCNPTSATVSQSVCNTYTSPSGNYTWSASGTYNDTIPNAAGCDSVLTINLTINTVTAAYTLYPDPDTTQLHHWFAIANVNGTPPYTYLWSWGDGNTSTGATPSHTYSAPANYAICLTVTDGAGCTTTYCDSSTYISKTEEERLVITVDVVTQLPNGIATVTATDNSIHIIPNPCTTCEITGAVNAQDLMVTDIVGCKQNASFSKSANGYYINLPEASNGIFLLRNIKTGEVVKFVKE